MLGHWHFDLLQDVVDDSTVPQKLLLFEVVDEERRVQLDVLPSHEIGKAFGALLWGRQTRESLRRFTKGTGKTGKAFGAVLWER